MNTIYFVSRAKTSGPINQGLNILNGMKQNGRVHSTFVTLDPEVAEDSWLYRYKEAGINIAQFNVPLWKTLFAIPKLRRYVKDNAIDVIHASGLRVCFVALFAHTKAKIVITQRCNPNEIAERYSPLIQPFFNGFYLWLIKKMDVIVACSKSIQKILIKDYHINAECVQNGVNTEFFKPISKDAKQQLRKRLNLPVDKKVYLVLGSFRHRKNNGLIVDAFKKMNPKDSVVVFVGRGAEEELLKESAKGFENIIFIGHTNTPIDYLQSADILISASLAEGLPNTVLEAMSCGLPCILSDIGPHEEIVEGTEAGIIFDKNSVDELCSCLCDVSSWNLDEKSKIARNVAVENFGIKSLAAKYESIYKEVLKMK